MQEVNNTLPYDAQALPDIASALRSGEEEPKKVQEPLPEVPKGPLTVSEAYAFLGVAEADRGQLEKVKARFRKLSLKYHPDKNLGREEAAAEVFQAVHAAYHTLTTNNFDYERWAQARDMVRVRIRVRVRLGLGKVTLTRALTLTLGAGVHGSEF